MNYILQSFIKTKEYEKMKNENTPVAISGLIGVGKSALISALNMNEKRKVFVITYNEIEANELIKNIMYFTDNVKYFPKKEISIYDYDAESNGIEYNRIKILNDIYNNKNQIIVTTIEAVMQRMITKEKLYSNVLHLKRGEDVNIEKIKENLVKLGYKRENLVENEAEFSIRGDIIDVSLDNKNGIRIELWGDEIDNIRKFDLSSQRTVKMLDEITIFPASEEIFSGDIDDVADKILNLDYKRKHINSSESDEDIEVIKNGDYKLKIDKYFNEFYDKNECILDYLNDYSIIVDELGKTNQRIETIKKDNENLIKALIEKEKSVPEALQNMQSFEIKLDNYINLTQNNLKSNNLNLREINSVDLNELILDAKKAQKNNEKVIIECGTSNNRENIAKALDGAIKVDNIDSINIKNGQIYVTIGSITSGFENKLQNLVVLSDENFGNTKVLKRKRIKNETFKSGEKIVFADLKPNDYVVHRKYGIGIFTGIKSIEVDRIKKDYITIKYAGSDVLYVPTTELENVRKYIGGDVVTLNKLGSKDWENTKAKVKGNLKVVAKELIELYARREHSKGFAFSKDTPWQREFEDSFPYTETDDQLRCIEEVKKDMESDKPMDRLLCGDVGYGKTEVAMRAAFKAVMDSKQVAYLAPTTILANQQYEEFSKRMKSFPIRVELLNRFRTEKEQKEVIKKLKNGEVDIVIGTHRLLSNDVEFKDLGLLIIDEEHRFGVKAKEKIKKYKASIDVLTMTATPIPRTLQMSIVGIRDMSVIYEPPQDRKPIQTYVLEYDKEIITEAITKELERKGQVFYIYNNVSDIGIKADEISKLVPEAKVSFAHGQMSGEQIEKIMQDFIDKKSNVLVCTTILESGIDIPNANTIIVENADHFGLAQLYQIRGRVGRSNKQAYAYITYRKDKIMSEDANKRLNAIKEFTEFGSGFKIATRDLQIRGAGSLFGEIQSGHMEQVGYDMYNHLLNEVIEETRGENKKKKEEETAVDIKLSAYIPDSYIEDSAQKVEIYQDIADCKNDEDIQNITDEIIDRYGDIPEEVNNLLKVIKIKNAAESKGIIKIQSKQMGVVFTFSENIFNEELVRKLMDKYYNRIKFSSGVKPYITLEIKNDIYKEIMEFIENL